jgi:NAD(P)-dependent dehydrogenase (short-subunit alcohol dehydrogenase family)
MLELQGKVAFITGGASGIGLGQAKVLAEEEGMKVVIADVQQNRLDEAKEYFQGGNAAFHAINLDITDRDAYARAADEAQEVFGPVQVLMNTAGVSVRVPVEQATYEDWDWHIDVNIRGTINGIQTLLPRMIQHGAGGHIVNCASISAFFAIPTAGPYTMTKYALRGLSESLRVELKAHDIDVSCLCPGSVNTNFLDVGVTRPAKFAKTGFVDDPDAHVLVKKHMESGFDPVELARRTVTGMKRNDLWIFPYPEFVFSMEAKHKLLIESLNLWNDDPDYTRRMKLRKKMGLPPVPLLS